MPADLLVRVNGEERRVAAGTTLSGLVAALGLGDARVAIEVNLDVVPRARHSEVVVADGDRIEIVSFVGGG